VFAALSVVDGIPKITTRIEFYYLAKVIEIIVV
jgi:hypothetical protein